MRKKLMKTVAISVGFAIALFVTACGSGAGNSPEGGGNGEASSVEYPEQPIEIIVAYAAGGGMDVTARILAGPLSEQLGTDVTVSNIIGGGGVVGYSTGASAAADGYTLTLASSAIAEHEFFREEEIPYTADTWEPSYMVSNESHVLVVPTDSEYQTAEEFLAAANRGDELHMGVSGRLASQDVARALIEEAGGFDFGTVYFDGGAPVVIALLAGDVDFGFVFQTEVAGQLEAGTLRALATTGAERTEENPDLPTLSELGIEVDTGTWRALVAPKGTPESVMTAINDAMAEVVKDPEWIAAMDEAGVPVVTQEPSEFVNTMMATSENSKTIAPLLLTD